MFSVLRETIRWTALVALMIGAALVLPAAALARDLLETLTDERSYADAIGHLDIAGLLAEHGAVVTESIVGLLPEVVVDSLGEDAEILHRAAGAALEEALTDVAAQIPAYVAGRRDALTGRVDLTGFRAAVVSVVGEDLPLGELLEGPVAAGVDAALPQSLPLDSQLAHLETALAPLRALARAVARQVTRLHRLGWILLGLAILVAFHLRRIAVVAGLVLLSAGMTSLAAALLADAISGWVLPDAIARLPLTEDFLLRPVHGLERQAVCWLTVGGASVAAAALAPVIGRRVEARWEGCRGALFLALLAPGRARWSLATLIGGAVGYPMFVLRGVPAARAVIGGRVVTATLLDYAGPVLVTGLLPALGELGGLGWLGAVANGPIWCALVVFWLLRDRPASGGGFNIVDRACGVARVRAPGCSARLASARRAVPLVATVLVGVFAPTGLVFGAAGLIDSMGVFAGRHDRTLGDRIAGTRARLSPGV